MIKLHSPDHKSLISFFSFLFLLIPIALLTGPAIPDIILSIIALFFLIISVSNKMWGYYKNYFVIGFFLFLFYGILRSIFSEFPWYSLSEGGSLFYFRYLFFVLGVSYLLKSNPKLLNKFMLIVFLCLLTVSLDGIYQYLFGQNLLGIGPAENQRISGVFGEEAVLGRYISYFTVIYIFMFFSSDLKKIEAQKI